MFGEGEMLHAESAESSQGNPVAAQDELQVNLVDESLFAEPVQSQKSVQHGLFGNEEPSRPVPARTEMHRKPISEQRESYYSARTVPQNPQIAKNIDTEARKIKEIRVFFSDGTYESFVPSGK